MNKKFKLPIIMQIISPYVFILSISIILFSYSNRTFFYGTGFDSILSGKSALLALSLMIAISSLLIIITMLIEYLIKYIKFYKKKKVLMICPNCHKNLYVKGYKKEYIDMSNIKLTCLNCNNEIFRKGLF